MRAFEGGAEALALLKGLAEAAAVRLCKHGASARRRQVCERLAQGGVVGELVDARFAVNDPRGLPVALQNLLVAVDRVGPDSVWRVLRRERVRQPGGYGSAIFVQRTPVRGHLPDK